MIAYEVEIKDRATPVLRALLGNATSVCRRGIAITVAHGMLRAAGSTAMVGL